jgi:hypothetical protein
MLLLCGEPERSDLRLDNPSPLFYSHFKSFSAVLAHSEQDPMLEKIPVGAIVGLFTWLPRKAKEWYTYSRPAGKVLGSCLDNGRQLNIFLKDMFVPDNTEATPKLASQEGPIMLVHFNIDKVWPEVEARGAADLLNLLGKLRKDKRLDIVEMSRGYDIWNTNIIVLGAQAGKSNAYYEMMKNVGYYVDESGIYDASTKAPIPLKPGYGYGLILKARNQQTLHENGIAILLGGYGTLGTEAAVYYFCNHIAALGRQFGRNCFSIIVRARLDSGRQSATRLKEYDKVFP